ncbi:hypothetical protein L226DRAFT_469797 [Lentinus tigrinus ALCF2SS1-7]|uniref:F-box domain-containing protein n=1 Tax=Lentinus tigrinus ALCF2SS1-6 TaxID=1328759 RepID=A0A5C2RX38_9APHY|nr:hypothetical protein L227DRAFT_306367 [Lentinus tigrinus ALCF2SS1-6]RPD70647.1 hypothetical protein L226DRAFT_469797 [Lentinus tigrinus ALCF2SS1-7]
MTTLISLPAELLAQIMACLSEDGHTLKSCSLACRRLLPVSQYYLFSYVDFEVLDHLEAEPFRSHITHLKLSPKSEVLAAYPDALIKSAISLPRLTGICAHQVSFQYMSFPAAVHTQLVAFTAVVELSLYETTHPDREHVQGILCALPNLSRLSLRSVTLLTGPRYSKRNPPPRETSGPRLTYLRASPSYSMDSTTTIVEWLHRTLTADTLRALVLPADSKNSEVVFNGFGPYVESLTIERLESITRKWDVAFITRYTALRTLDVGWDLCGPQRWYQLYKMLYSMDSPRLCEVVLRFDATQDLDSVIELDAFLASPIDSYLTRSFPRLHRVCIIIRADASTLPITKREQLRIAVKMWMERLDGLGKLQIEFDYVGKVTSGFFNDI